MHLRTPVMLMISLLTISCGPRSIQKHPIPREREIQSFRLLGEGDLLLQEGKDHLAMLKYLEASELNPYYEVIFNKLAITYVRLRMLSQARAAVDRALALKRKYAYGYNTKGIIDLAFSDSSAAAGAFAKAIDIMPGVPNFYINYGFSLVQLGRASEAMEAYRKALSLDPHIFEQKNMVELTYSSESDLSPEQYYNLAVVFAKLGNLSYTVRYLSRAFGGGFSDFDRVKAEPAFQRLAANDQFRRFLAIHGVFL